MTQPTLFKGSANHAQYKINSNFILIVMTQPTLFKGSANHAQYKINSNFILIAYGLHFYYR